MVTVNIKVTKIKELPMLTIKHYVRAESLEEAYELNQKKSNRILGGMLWMKTGNSTINTAIDLSDLGLDKIEETDDAFSIGAMVTLRQLEMHESLNSYTDGAVKDAVKDIVGVQFRNMATIGGSIWGRFGFSDVLTVFMTMDASVELYNAGIIPIEEFSKGSYPNDILVRIIVNKPESSYVYRAMRIQSTDFPVLTCAASIIGDECRIAVGARPKRAILLNIDKETALSSPEDTALKLSEEIPTESNSRGSAEYRKHLAQVLIERNLKHLGGLK